MITVTFLPFRRGLWAFRKSAQPEELTRPDVQLEDDEAAFKHIRCPLCHWRPTAASRWVCATCGPPENFAYGCGTVWNTFTTQGLCPGCGHQWRWTTCLYCHGWSLHEDWYVAEQD